MSIRDLAAKVSGWLQGRKSSASSGYQPQVDQQGLICDENDSPAAEARPQQHPGPEKMVVKTVAKAKKQEPIEKLQEGFDNLINQLQSINEHLNRQAEQHEQLISRIDKLPKLLESFPQVVANQQETARQLLEQLKAAAAKNEQFLSAVERIPNETAKQTDALVNIDHQLAAAADTDVQIMESFNRFNETLERLNKTAGLQADSIGQMRRTFATSDRYLKYLVSKQNKRFIWVLFIAVGVCVFAILLLVGVIIYLQQSGS